MAIYERSFDCLKLLIEESSIRQGMKGQLPEYNFGEGIQFSNLAVPLLVESRDVTILSYLLKDDGFVLSSQDFSSFLSMAAKADWVEGINSFLWASNPQFVFRQLAYDSQTEVLRNFVNCLTDSQKKKIVNHSLAIRPYCQHMVLLLLEDRSFIDVPGDLCVELLKHLQSEDLIQLGINRPEIMEQVLEGPTKYEREMNKIFKRFRGEGVLEKSQRVRAVRFEKQ